MSFDEWCVVLETRDRDGAPYNNICRHVIGDTAEQVVDYALERLVGVTAGERHLIDGWRVVAALAIREANVRAFGIEPITEPVFRRVES